MLMALGLLTALAAAGMIGVMIVAIVVEHWKVGFFIFKPNQGWEYCASIAVTAFVIAMVGPGGGRSITPSASTGTDGPAPRSPPQPAWAAQHSSWRSATARSTNERHDRGRPNPSPDVGCGRSWC